MAARTVARSCMQSTYPAPTARAFLQLASRRPLPVLDFLAPRASVSQVTTRSILRLLPTCTPRTFGTTLARRETIAVYNPRKDEDGEEMRVEITHRASNVRQLLSSPSYDVVTLTDLILYGKGMKAMLTKSH